MRKITSIGLIAHDEMKDKLVAWCTHYAPYLAPHELVATGTTGQRIADAVETLDIVRLASGPLGGDQQIGARIATGDLDLLIFFADPLTAMPHDVDVKALSRLALVYDIPMACNPSTANALAVSLLGAPDGEGPAL